MASGNAVFSLVDLGLARALSVADAQTQNFVNWVNTANDGISSALSASTTPPSGRPSHPSTGPAIDGRDEWVFKPEVEIPRRADGVDTATYDNTSRKIISDLTTNFAAFFTRYFPNDTPAVTAAQAWLTDAITSGGTGIPAHVEDQIWQRDRSRVLNDVARAQDELVASYAARRFPLPPGVLAHQSYLIQRDGMDKIAQASRDVAIEQVKIAIENVRFAVEKALDFRLRAVDAASNYLRALALGPEIASRLALNKADAQAKLISAASQFYQSRLSFVQLEHDFQKYRDTQKLQADLSVMENLTRQFGLRNDIITARAKALADNVMSAAQSAGTMASAALNAMNTGASVSARAELDD